MRRSPRGILRCVALWLLGCIPILIFWFPPFLWAEQAVRVATYNIKFLSTKVVNQGNRLEKLKTVIELLEADVLGLQEIDDRDALKLLFPEDQWHIVIDDQSGNTQDLAVVVRKPLQVRGFDADLDANDVHFLFPSSAQNTFFPNRRDILLVEVGLSEVHDSFIVLVHHGKSRFGGRTTTEFRRVGAGQMLLQALERDFEDRNYILLGDFNDSPDDRSVNILESGNPNVIGAMEDTPGPFLINLTEPLYSQGVVSHGRKTNELIGDRIDLIDPTSRQRNDEARGTNTNTGDILFDQILIPPQMLRHYVGDSVGVFDFAVGARGNNATRASDHLPVYADFVFAGQETNAVHLQISALLPNPVGKDAGNETVTLTNPTETSIALAGWRLKDRANNEYFLTGSVQKNESVTIVMTKFSMPLNNSGDTVSLIDPQGHMRDEVTYTKLEVKPGKEIVFE